MKPSTITVAWDSDYPLHWKPGVHVHRSGGKLASWRAWWLFLAVAWYRKTDYDLVTKSWGWSDK